LKLRELAALAVVATVLLEIAVPGRDVYHAGWLNVLLVALAVLAIAPAGKAVRAAAGAPARWSVAAAAFGVAIVAIAGVANGLLAPDDSRVIGAPGERVRNADLGGILVFPLLSPSPENAQAATVTLERDGGAFEIGPRTRVAGSFALHTEERTVVLIEARDPGGAHLTVTQPTGSAFLSPVLLMQHHQTIAGMDVPFDSFAVPAAHRLVKAVLLTPQQASAMRGMEGLAIPAVLFAVDDERDQPLPHGIALDPGGAAIAVGGLRLRALVLDYPAVAVEPVPQLEVAVLGALLVAAGAIGSAVARARRG